MFGFVKSAMSLGAMPVVHDVRRHELAAQRDASLHSMDDVLFALCEAQVSEDVQMVRTEKASPQRPTPDGHIAERL